MKIEQKICISETALHIDWQLYTSMQPSKIFSLVHYRTEYFLKICKTCSLTMCWHDFKILSYPFLPDSIFPHDNHYTATHRFLFIHNCLYNLDWFLVWDLCNLKNFGITYSKSGYTWECLCYRIFWLLKYLYCVTQPLHMHSKFSSDWLSSYIRTLQPVVEIFIMAVYILNRPHAKKPHSGI